MIWPHLLSPVVDIACPTAYTEDILPFPAASLEWDRTPPRILLQGKTTPGPPPLNP